MDLTVLKTLLTAQDQAYKSALELFMNQVNKKTEKLESTVSELTRSLEFTQAQVEEYRSEMKQLKREKETDQARITELTEDLRESRQLVTDLEEKCVYLDDYSRRKNLHISGLEEPRDQETWEQTAKKVSSLLETKLQLPDIVIESPPRWPRDYASATPCDRPFPSFLRP